LLSPRGFSILVEVNGNGKGTMKKAPVLLLVEDSSADIKITQRALRESGAAVELVILRDGQEAVDYLLRHATPESHGTWRRPDLVLLDLNLPRLSGREVLAQIRATKALRLIPVVVLTTSRRAEEIQELYAAGANTYIEKPQDFKRFVDVLRTIQHYWLDLALLPSEPDVQ
jgi:chemotaxis family two-component system response regulator Rcp1